jgi:hypothetical protein
VIETLALRFRNLFGIVQAVELALTREDDDSGDDRAGKRTASGLIEAGDGPISAAPGFRLKEVGRLHASSAQDDGGLTVTGQLRGPLHQALPAETTSSAVAPTALVADRDSALGPAENSRSPTLAIFPFFSLK